MNEIIDNNHGQSFSTGLVFGGYILVIFGIIFLVGNPLIGVATFLLGGYIVFTRTGIMINPQTKQYKDYTQYFGIKTGEWKDLSKYSDLSVLKTRMLTSSFSRSNRPLNEVNHYYNIYLLSKSHRKKLLFRRFEIKEEAMAEANKMAKLLSKELKAYHPQGAVSKTKQS